MDQTPLVRDQIDDGLKLIEQLKRDHFDVTAAFWVKDPEDGRWLLYIASKVVGEKGLSKSYEEMHPSLLKLPEPDKDRWFGLAPLRLIGATDPITTAVLDIRNRRATTVPTRYQGNRLGKLDIDEAYIYSADKSTLLK